jgi:hypothetical protein
MGELETSLLPKGPSGRKPSASIEIKGKRGINPESMLVLFEDGSMGVKQGADVGIWGFISPKTKPFDGSDYAMIFHSHTQFAKIEKIVSNPNIGKIERLCYGLAHSLFIIYLVLFLYTRINLDWPTLLIDIGGYTNVLLFGIPVLIYLALNNWIDSGNLKIHLMESEPHIIPMQLIAVKKINNLLLVILALAAGCQPGSRNELFCDSMILLSFVFAVWSYINNTTDKYEIDDFIGEVNTIHIEQEKKDRTENPLIKLLMDNESPTLEFKASLWTQYHGVTDEIIEKQKNKMYELEDSVVKTVAAFLNTAGGTLLVGIKDKPRNAGNAVADVLGIEPDFRWLKKGKQDTEGFEHVLIELFNKSLSNPVANQYIAITFPVYEGKIICRIDVQPLPRIIGQQCFAETKTMDTKLFVRSGDSTIPQSRETEYHYIRHHFEGHSENNNT